MTLRQVAPGRYRGEFAVSEPGRYFLNLSAEGAAQPVTVRTFGFAVPYSPEYLDLGVDRDLLEALAMRTDGEVLALGDESVARIVAPRPHAIGDRERVWWPLLVAALAFVLLELAVRKLTLPEAMRSRWRRHPGTVAHAGEPDYEALRKRIAEVRARHLAALRDGVVVALDDPAARARLYLARRRPTR